MRGVKRRTVIGRLGIAAACSSIWWECWDEDEDEDDALWRTRESFFFGEERLEMTRARD